MDNFLVRSGQRWKFQLGGWMISAIGAAMLINAHGLFTDPPAAEWRWWLHIASPPLGILVGVWMVFAIRCPSCGEKLLWRAVSDQSLTAWLFWSGTNQSCPWCGSDGSSVWQGTPGLRVRTEDDSILNLRERRAEGGDSGPPPFS
jgi:hypothetical protein